MSTTTESASELAAALAPTASADVLRHRWVVILARGERAERIIAPAPGDNYRRKLARLLAATAAIAPERTFSVVHELDSPWWAPVLAFLPPENVIDQPLDRGTATGLALALVMILQRDPTAEVVVATLGADPETLARQVEAPTPAVHAGQSERSLLCALDRREVVLCTGSLPAWMRLYHEAQPELLSTMVDLAKRAAESAVQPLLDALYPFLSALDLGRDVFGLAPGEGGDLMRYSV